ncbi:large exoprotein [Microbacterium pumilum]|uniref:Large exoprotein n=1 Tax=Microbacterium pumilum TaxID=344165 RepID=A0ABP5EEU7_9MICO
MGGQVLGGGVIVLVAVLLWLVYLLPSWHSRRQYDAAERNAVRLNQALRVLAETNESPEEVRLELNARTALAQQRLARRALAEREQTALEGSRIALEQARNERAAARFTPVARRTRARRRTRLTLTVLGLLSVGVAVWGGFEVVATGSQVMLWAGVAGALVAGLAVRRMSRIGARSVAKTTDVAPPVVAAFLQDVPLSGDRKKWAPRDLPRPLTASAGSRAAMVLDAEAERDALRQVTVEEEMRRRAEAQRPPSIVAARAAKASEFSRMGVVDDAEIEAHVRELLARRAVGE